MKSWLELAELYRKCHEQTMANIWSIMTRNPMKRTFAYPWGVVEDETKNKPDAQERLREAVTAVVECVAADTETLDEKRLKLHQVALAFSLMANDPNLT